ncbi:response regulator transcription factor [Flavisolibacter ginsenosidimutans]|nr:response regulator transcription factor [Flavisolibacter ginsenosidimutans]
MIKVFLADDLPIFLEGLQSILQYQAVVAITSTAANGIEVLQQLPEKMPDVLITDIQMPEMNGIELTKEIFKHYPSIRVIGLTMFKEDHLLVEMLEAGARGYLLKTCTKEQVLEAVQAVHAGGFYFCSGTTPKLTRLIAKSHLRGFPKMEEGKFSATEIQIIRGICEEMSTREISQSLYLGERTIESYRHKIFEKAGVKNMAGLVIYAVKNGLYEV